MNPKDFRNYQNQIDLFKDLKDSNINSKEVLKDQINVKSDLSEIKKENEKSKSKDQISVMQNVEKCFDLRKKNIDLFRDYSLLLPEAKYKSKYGRCIKILAPKQMLQRLGLAQVKAGNTSENLLNEIRQIICSLY